ncbi:MAG: YdcF family protein [Thiohalomonadaceae bacterium]
MLLISIVLICCSGGLTFFWMLHRVYRTASAASCELAATTCVLVPGVRLVDDAVGMDFRLRLERALALHKAGAGSLLLLGGFTGQSDVSEAAKGAEYLSSRGLAAEFMRLEESSCHTLGNLRNARELLSKNTPVSIVSNRYHLARLAVIADGLGMQHQLCAAEERWCNSGAIFARLLLEAFYLHWYLTGRYWARLVGDKEILSKIS